MVKRKRKGNAWMGGGPPMIVPPMMPMPYMMMPPMQFPMPQALSGQGFEQPVPAREPAGTVPSTKSPSAENVFGALGTWKDLPPVEIVHTVVLVDFSAMLHIPAPNHKLVSAQTVKLLESGLETDSWYDRVDVLDQSIAEAAWNESLIELVQEACKDDGCVVVINTGRIIERTELIRQVLETKGVNPSMFTHNDPQQPQKVRKTQLVFRIWHYFLKANFLYYECPSTPRFHRELLGQLQRLAQPDRPLPQVFEVNSPRRSLDPMIERQILETIVTDREDLEAFTHTDKWVWRVVNYDAIINLLDSLGLGSEKISDYRGRSFDCESQSMPVLSDLGRKQPLHIRRVIANGQMVSIVLDNGMPIMVAKLKSRTEDVNWDINMDLETVLDVDRFITIRKKEQ